MGSDETETNTDPTGDHLSEPDDGAPGRWLRPLHFAYAALALLPAFIVMCADAHFALSVPLVALSCSAGAFFILSGFGSIERAPLASDGPSFRSLAPRLIELVGSGAALVAALRLAVAGVLPWPIVTAAVLVTGGTLWVVTACYRVLEGLGVTSGRPLFKRHGFWLFVANVLVYLPLLGSFSLSDPWETHYGEVAREMLSRDDWISLWWAQDGWFWSKPVLDFWLQGISFHLLGVGYLPDQMLVGASVGLFPQPEWAARLPVFLLTVIASQVLYRAIVPSFGRRAALLGGLVLTSMPYWYLLAHQSMTDMPYVAPLATALGFVLLGVQTDPEKQARVFSVPLGAQSYAISARHVVLGLVLVTVLPQVLYLFSRHLTLQIANPPYGFRWHLDEFFAGSGGGNCGIPGNAECVRYVPLDPILQPGLAAVIWSVVLGILLLSNRDEGRLQRLYFLLAWYFTALATMAKGAPGLVLPLAITCVSLAATRRFRDFARLELPAMLLIVLCVALPWYVQMYARHGSPFIDRLLIHDMYKRAFTHVHDTNAGDDTSFRYYIWQLGYGLFPFTGLAGTALLYFQRFGDEARSRRAQTLAWLMLWLLLVFGMFSVTKTKFHHYILPAVPPLALLSGIVLDRAFRGPLASKARLIPYLASLGAAALLVAYGVARLFPGSILGDSNAEAHGALTAAAAATSLVLGALALVLGVRWFSSREEPATRAGGVDSWFLGISGLCGAVFVLLAGRDLFTSLELNGSVRLMHLFTYNYARAWPPTLDFTTTFKAFTLVAAAISVALAFPRLRRHAAVLLTAFGLITAFFGVNVYLVRLSPHWGQRETILEYYRRRESPQEPLVAYQMNWKGENFYTGNRLPAFVRSGTAFKNYVKEQRDKGVRVIFVSTEHSRVNSLKNELGTVKKFEPLTTPALNNKFFVARVEL
jgi:4-amino-4-deoxy-L-arabinose transferase-like glycosyltransferase